MPERSEHKPAFADKVPAFGLSRCRKAISCMSIGAFDGDSLANALSAAGLATSAARAAGSQQWYIAGEESLPPSASPCLSII